MTQLPPEPTATRETQTAEGLQPTPITASAPYVSETSRYPELRDAVEPFCRGYGMDIGFGGDPINSGAIRMDLPTPYASTGNLPVQLGGDCRDLRWFRDEALDYVYSSHVLEDFAEHETEAVMREWVRVLRVGGYLVLLLPDQVRYVEHCRQKGEQSNEHHLIAHFSLDYVKEAAARLGNLEVAMERPSIGPYSFTIALQKTHAATVAATEQQSMRDQIQQVWSERDALKVALRQREQNLAEETQRRKEFEQRSGEQAARLNYYENHPAYRAYRALRTLGRPSKPQG